MELFHTSPVPIEKIDPYLGQFGTYLFFALEPYQTVSCGVITYMLDIEDLDIIEDSMIFDGQVDAGLNEEERKNLYDILVETVELTGCDEESAVALLDGSETLYELSCGDAFSGEEQGDLGWDLQLLTARAASAIGYDGVQLQDEQGPVWMINMLGKEKDLVLVDDGR